jgi:rRNA-processing protein FCF1
MNFKEIFIKTCYDGDDILEALRKGYVTPDELISADVHRFAETLVDYYVEINQRIPDCVIKELSTANLLRLFAKTKNQQLREKILTLDADDICSECEYSWRIYDIKQCVVVDTDILNYFANQLASLPKIPERTIRENCQVLWEAIKARRKEIRKNTHKPKSTDPTPRYKHKLEEAIMKNDEYYYDPITAKVYHSALSDEEFFRLLPYWLKTKPELKKYILETPQFSKLPYDVQLAVIKDCEKIIANKKCEIKYFPKEALKEVDLHTAYVVLLSEFGNIHEQIITPPMDEEEIMTIFAPLCLAYPDKVSVAIKLYQAVVLMRKIMKNEPIENSIEVDESQEFFIVKTLDKYFDFQHSSVPIMTQAKSLLEILRVSNLVVRDKLKETIEEHKRISHKLYL